MGFTTAFLSTFTLTSSLLYLTLHAHRESRLSQSLTLRQSTLILQNVYEPLPLPPPTSAREERTGMVEAAKDRWNREIEGAVRWAWRYDWRGLGEEVEERVRTVARRVRESGSS